MEARGLKKPGRGHIACCFSKCTQFTENGELTGEIACLVRAKCAQTIEFIGDEAANAGRGAARNSETRETKRTAVFFDRRMTDAGRGGRGVRPSSARIADGRIRARGARSCFAWSRKAYRKAVPIRCPSPLCE